MNVLVRVTVVAGPTTAQVVLPAVLPLAEVVPDLLQSVGLLEAATVPSGCRVERSPGRPLRPDLGLAAQGVADGAVLVVRPGPGRDHSSRYDDVLAPPPVRGPRARLRSVARRR